ncbi:helix-turn-helix domain-containing protein [Mucilaginibacter sp. JRF]|uniref:helix-turn-helix domain-containing protein n=1 Tax=Mucilaginibacter sp. JRF TaxID=2780088 RepID=UPI00187E9001|nr:helix-turn-helix domain-containing protein [Mucilaginibacter sp. JRF]MBE9586963.1 helix-turn-helix domain-containing protein [Mucilaginibacter sp. JRF]
MSKDSHNHGKIIIKAIRRSGNTITGLAKELNVNRRTIYNWLSADSIKKEIIHRIGLASKYDFSNEFPQYFSEDTFSLKSIYQENEWEINSDSLEWKDKYIGLLEQFNKLLVSMSVGK